MLSAVIAVNNYSVANAWRVCGELAEVGLLDFGVLSRMSETEIYDALGKSGYRHSDFVQRLLAARIKGLATCLAADPDRLLLAASETTVEGVSRAFGRLPGVGPRVIEKFLILAQGGQ